MQSIPAMTSLLLLLLLQILVQASTQPGQHVLTKLDITSPANILPNFSYSNIKKGRLLSPLKGDDGSMPGRKISLATPRPRVKNEVQKGMQRQKQRTPRPKLPKQPCLNKQTYCNNFAKQYELIWPYGMSDKYCLNIVLGCIRAIPERGRRALRKECPGTCQTVRSRFYENYEKSNKTLCKGVFSLVRNRKTRQVRYRRPNERFARATYLMSRKRRSKNYYKRCSKSYY